MKKLRFKVALMKRRFHRWQLKRIERKLYALRKKQLDLWSEQDG